MDKLPKEGSREYALADVLSRPNAIRGLYKKLKLPLEWEDLSKKSPAYITHMADLADRVIKEATDNGRDLNDPKVQEELQAAIHGGATGAFLGLAWYKFLHLFGSHKK